MDTPNPLSQELKRRYKASKYRSASELAAAASQIAGIEVTRFQVENMLTNRREYMQALNAVWAALEDAAPENG